MGPNDVDDEGAVVVEAAIQVEGVGEGEVEEVNDKVARQDCYCGPEIQQALQGS